MFWEKNLFFLEGFPTCFSSTFFHFLQNFWEKQILLSDHFGQNLLFSEILRKKHTKYFFQVQGAFKTKEINKTSEKTCSDRSDLSKQVFQIFLIFKKFWGWGDKGGEKPPKLEKKLSNVFSSKFQRKKSRFWPKCSQRRICFSQIFWRKWKKVEEKN